MKKLCTAIVVALSIFAATVTPAFAAVRVTAHTKTTASQGQSKKVVFTAKTSSPGTVKVTVYRSSKAIRIMKAKRSGAHYGANWNLLTSGGSRVKAGLYAYKVAVRTHSGRTGHMRGKVFLTPLATHTVSRWLGFYVPDVPSEMGPLASLESKIDTRAAVVHFYISDWESFPLSRVQRIAAHGSIPLVTLDFVRYAPDKGDNSILAGDSDKYLRDWADDAKAYGGPVWLRPFPEMNGNWAAWCGVIGSNTTAKTVAAWKRVHNIFAEEGATNVKFVWNVNGMSIPDTSANAIEKYWPGDAYVDYVSIDGYNFGNHASWSNWATPESIFGDAYRRITALTSKPLFIAETACTSNGGNKPAWMTNFFESVGTQFPKIKGVCWFNADKEEDWRVDENADTVAAMRKLFQSGY